MSLLTPFHQTSSPKVLSGGYIRKQTVFWTNRLMGMMLRDSLSILKPASTPGHPSVPDSILTLILDPYLRGGEEEEERRVE